MIQTKSRLLLAGGLFILIAATLVVVRRGYAFVVDRPSVRLNDFPEHLGDWNVQRATIPENEKQTLGAEDSISVVLTDSIGRAAQMHLAVWTDPTEVAETCPHHPNICYEGNGWMRTQTRRITIESPTGPIPVEVSEMAQGQQRFVIAFTYQMGGQRYCTDLQARSVQTALWGQKRWPPVKKLLLQVPGGSIEAALPVIKELFVETTNWIANAAGDNGLVQGGTTPGGRAENDVVTDAAAPQVLSMSAASVPVTIGHSIQEPARAAS